MFSRTNLKLLIRIAVSTVLIWWFTASFNWGELIRSLAGVNYLWLLVGALWVITAVAVSVIKWRIILHAQGLRLSWKELWSAYWAGLFFNNFLPSSIGGDAIRVIWVGRTTRNSAGVAASVAIERVLATTGLSLVGGLACMFVQSPRLEIVLLFIALVIISLSLLALLTLGKVPAFIIKRALPAGCSKFSGVSSRTARFLAGIIENGRLIRNRPWVILRVILWSMIFQFCVAAVNYCIFRGLDMIQLGPAEIIYIVPVISIAAMLPLGINGYGIREGAYITLLGTYGITAAQAFSSSLIFALLVSLVSLWGGWLWLNHRNEEEGRHASFEGL